MQVDESHYQTLLNGDDWEAAYDISSPNYGPAGPVSLEARREVGQWALEMMERSPEFREFMRSRGSIDLPFGVIFRARFGPLKAG